MAHKCEWCSFTVAELEAPEDKDRVDELNGQAAAHEEDRAILRNCLEARRP
jgi:hypothetical protein